MLRRMNLIALTAALIGAFAMGGSAIAARKTCPDGSFPPCNKPPVGETASNNLSYPAIWAENVMEGFTQSLDVPWEFAPVFYDGVNYYTQKSGEEPVYCVGETDIVPPNTVPAEILCYHGRMNLGISEETGLREFEGDPKVWWLQQRAENKWQVFNIEDPDKTTPVVVTGADTGDLLESSDVIKAKQIRTEFGLFKHVDAYAPLGLLADPDFTGYRPGACVLDATIPTNCFAAHRMSGAVPGTDQSIAEIQGTDWPGPVGAPDYELLDPRQVRTIRNYFDPSIAVPAAAPGTEESEPDPRIVVLDEPLGVDALVYTDCARLIIQKVTGDPAELYWDSDAEGGSWMPRSVANPPVVDINTWSGSYSVEINAGGGLIYGYNWNTKSFAEGSGVYRLTLLLEGGPSAGGACDVERSTVFDETSMSVNVGERRPATMLSAAALGGTRGEGGAVYVDVQIATGGGGGRP
jgi:hypothetical protein